MASSRWMIASFSLLIFWKRLYLCDSNHHFSSFSRKPHFFELCGGAKTMTEICILDINGWIFMVNCCIEITIYSLFKTLCLRKLQYLSINSSTLPMTRQVWDIWLEDLKSGTTNLLILMWWTPYYYWNQHCKHPDTYLCYNCSPFKKCLSHDREERNV